MDYFETAEVKNLEIKSACADFRILEASDDKISVLAERVEDGLYFCKNANGTLQIHYDVKRRMIDHRNHNHPQIDVYLPAGMIFSNVNLEMGVGSLAAENIQIGEKLTVDIGAGEVKLERVTAKEVVAECGVGKFSMRGSVGGNMTVNCGLGECGIQLDGKENDYNYDISCALGKININGNSGGHFASTKRMMNTNVIGTIKLECGLGTIKLETK